MGIPSSVWWSQKRKVSMGSESKNVRLLKNYWLHSDFVRNQIKYDLLESLLNSYFLICVGLNLITIQNLEYFSINKTIKNNKIKLWTSIEIHKNQKIFISKNKLFLKDSGYFLFKYLRIESLTIDFLSSSYVSLSSLKPYGDFDGFHSNPV